ncbi:hypothetical protein [Chamaesiphon minutus]|uniref:Uncharacterized protein n=1 Tax=Chamaesiphon minutus (strain ATCC 27169 / PCC 6605) TaxID=1173020 RepID=K9UH95_CHAP6|nr:hypothetical protein [Chamaesiphon minutus]AFY94477.1 hypothetical protein Cha6605_3486 [Chamaesiphon minutus PCC 6605]
MQVKSVLLLALTLGFSIKIMPASLADSTIDKSERNTSLVSNIKKTIDVSKISIGGLKLGMTTREVTKILGKPRQIKQQYDDTCFQRYTTDLTYNKLKVFMLGSTKNNARIHSIYTSNPAYRTSEGIRVGNRKSQAKQAYANFKADGNDKYPLVYINSSFGGLGFKTRNDLITSIDLISSSC